MPDAAPKAAAVKPPGAAKAKESKDTKPDTGRPVGRPPNLQKQLEDQFMTMGMMLSMVDQFDGELVAENASELAEAWYKLAQQNKAVKRILEGIMETGAWSGVIMTTAAIAIPIADNHGLIPENIPHPFKKPPHKQSAVPMAGAPGQPAPTHAPQAGSPIKPSGARVPPEPPPGQHRHGS